ARAASHERREGGGAAAQPDGRRARSRHDPAHRPRPAGCAAGAARPIGGKPESHYASSYPALARALTTEGLHLEPRLHIVRHRLRLNSVGIVGMTADPHARLETFDRQRVALAQAVLDHETRAAELADLRFDVDVLAEPRGNEKPRAHVHQRHTG